MQFDKNFRGTLQSMLVPPKASRTISISAKVRNSCQKTQKKLIIRPHQVGLMLNAKKRLAHVRRCQNKSVVPTRTKPSVPGANENIKVAQETLKIGDNFFVSENTPSLLLEKLSQVLKIS